MNKILKILSILVIGFVMFSCANPSSNDDWSNVIIPSTEEPATEEPTYSITFIAEKYPERDKSIADFLNSLPGYKNLKEGAKVDYLPSIIYATIEEKCTLNRTESSIYKIEIIYEDNITSVVVGNENIEIKIEAEVKDLED